MSSIIDQKEYLKKYLGKKPGEKSKKKKKTANRVKRTTIIDDNVDLDFTVSKNLEEDEDAPQIVAIIDERPPSLRIDDETKNSLWKPLGAADAANIVSNHPQPRKAVFKINKIEISHKDFSHRERYVYDNDMSPPRKRITSHNLSPMCENNDIEQENIKREVCDDISPPRRSKHTKVKSPRRSFREVRTVVGDNSPPRKSTKTDLSPPRKANNRKDDSSHSRRRESPKRKYEKMSETLDGKKAGLQNAQELSEENRKLRKEELEMFKRMPKHISGENAVPVVRDKKTGRIRDLEEEAIQQRKKQEEDDKNKEKYTRWGKGLAQIESHQQDIQEQLNEMNKPLARYADDADLEKYLKEQEREGDPMLAYLRSKKRKDDAKKGVLEKPKFQGEFMPNRYGIRPGHRWDGVDRSNGYEKKWFEVQNEKRAQIEDSYKWSTEDM